MSETHSQDYVEAREILDGKTNMHIGVRHLEALEEHYQCEILKVAYDMEQLATEFRQRN